MPFFIQMQSKHSSGPAIFASQPVPFDRVCADPRKRLQHAPSLFQAFR